MNRQNISKCGEQTFEMVDDSTMERTLILPNSTQLNASDSQFITHSLNEMSQRSEHGIKKLVTPKSVKRAQVQNAGNNQSQRRNDKLPPMPISSAKKKEGHSRHQSQTQNYEKKYISGPYQPDKENVTHNVISMKDSQTGSQKPVALKGRN